MGEIRISLSKEAHSKLKILSAIHNKNYSELVEQLIVHAPLPRIEWGVKIADEEKVEIEKAKTDLEEIKLKIGFREVED